MVGVIALVLVFRQSFENRSIIMETLFVFEYSCNYLSTYRQLTTGYLKLSSEILVYCIYKYIN